MKYSSSISALILGLAATLTFNCAAQSQDSTVVAKIAGTNLTTADFEKTQASDLLQARYQMYLSERKILDQYIDNQLLEVQAKKEGVTVDQLLEKEAYKGITDPTEDQLAVYYEGLGVDQPFATVHDQILTHIRDLRRSKAKTKYVDALRTKSNIKILLAPPTVKVDAENGNFHGSKDAPVTLVEFADYQCPYCAKVNPLVKQMEKDYGDKLTVVYKDFPLPMHKDSQKAAEGARCAGEQGKFWEYHDQLFTSHLVDVASLKKQAGDLKLDTAKFDACLDSGAEAAAVKKDLEEGKKLGLTATPSFFVNGHFFSGAADANTMHEIIGMAMPAGTSAAVPPTAVAQVTGK
jgi:protein-disulfide isomerase